VGEWAEPAARATGALACFAQRFGEAPVLWLSRRARELAGDASPAPVTPEDPGARAALQQGIALLEIADGPLAFARDLCRVVLAVGLDAPDGGPLAVAWLGFASEPDRDRIEGARDLLRRGAEAERRFRRFFDHLPAVLLAVDLEEDRVIDCNDRVERLGYTREEVLGRPGSSFFLPGERERLRSSLMASGNARREVALQDRSGVVRLIDLTVGLVREGGGPPREIVAVGRELRVEEKRLEHDRRMEAVGRLISGVAHELNNPLLTVVGNAEMLAEAKLSGPARRRAERVLSGARRCQDVVDELLRLRLRPKELDQEVDLEAVVARALRSVRGELEGRSEPQVDLRVPPSLPSVRGDHRDLEQAVAHILRNAFQAVADRPDGRVAVSVALGDRGVQVVIQDNGPGMSPETLERAFEPFFTTREIGKGRGLGLSIALGVAHDHGGHLELRCEPSGVAALLTIPLPPR
jgi:PAS domain S-box-containing protein